MRTVIPPGRAGLIVIAAALVPVAVKKFRPMVRAVGNGLINAGKTFQKLADDAEREAQAEAKEGETTVKNTEAVQNEARENAPDVETASPMGQNEVVAKKTKGTAKKAAAAEPKKKPPVKEKENIKGTTPPTGNAKRARKAGTEDQAG
jgi:Sec-independent protein translocase protein TatA